MRLSIDGIGVTGAFGCGVEALAEALPKGAATVGTLTVPSPQGDLQLPAYRAETGGLEEFIPARSLRRIDRYSKLALLGASLALKDAGLTGTDLSRVGVIVASGYGATATTFSFVDSMMGGGDLCASPTHFANSVHNSAAASISVMLGITGPSLTVSQFEMSVPSALLTAQQWLAEKRVEAVLLGGVEELGDLMGYLWHRRYGKSQPVPVEISPLDPETDSCILGEGAAFLLLTAGGEGGKYCAIDSVEYGALLPARFALPYDALVILGADGRPELARRYRAFLGPGTRTACYAPLYGSMPAAGAFDLACGAVTLRQGRDVPQKVCAFRLAGTGYSAVHLATL